MSLLAKSCLCPGLITLINNLITSSGNPTDNLEYRWLEDYWKGQGFEIYKTLLSSKYQGRTFSQAALSIYRNFGAILFGLEIISFDGNKIFLNPGSQIIPKGCEIIGYIIAEDKETADSISEYKIHGNDKNNNSQQENSPRDEFVSYARSNQRKSSMSDDIVEDQQELNDSDLGIEDHRPESLTNAIIAGDWNKNSDKCYVVKEKIHLKDVTFTTLENNILAQQHIILCGAVDNFINFIMPLRAKYLEKYPPIVLLNEVEPTEKAWNLVSLFPDIYYVKGSSMNERDLIRANIERASTIVILTSEIEPSLPGEKGSPEDEALKKSMELSKEQEDLLDAKTIFKYKAVQRLRPDIQIVTEFVNPQNIAFLKSDPADYTLMKKFGYNHTPLFASGEIYISSIMDSLSCQAFYNPALIKVLNLLLLGDKTSSNNNNYGNQSAMNHNQNWRGKQRKQDFFSSNVKNSNLFHIKTPTVFVGRTFEDLFCFLATKQDIITLGLYRLPYCKDNKMPYVWTNPDPDTILTEKDLCFILAQTPPSDNYMEWGGPLEKNDYKRKRKRLRNYTSDSTQSENEETAVNYDEIERRNASTRQYIKDSEFVSQKITSIAEKITELKQNAKILDEVIQKRQPYLIDQIKTVISDELSQILKQKLSQLQQQQLAQQQQQQNLLNLQQQQQQQIEQQAQQDEQQQLSDQSSLQQDEPEDMVEVKHRLINSKELKDSR